MAKKKRDGMMDSKNNDDAVIQNLEDAGCDRDTIAAFVGDMREERIEEGLKLLAAHRRILPDNLHREQRRIDCLDYLVYNIERVRKMERK